MYLEDRTVRLQLWDTAGQVCVVLQYYCKNKSILILLAGEIQIVDPILH
jgi:GTPase SAR1 family protein